MDAELTAIARRHLVTGGLLSVAMIATYFGFVLLVAFHKALMGTLVARGLSLGIALGVLVILAAWALTGAYVWWANGHDEAVGRAGSRP